MGTTLLMALTLNANKFLNKALFRVFMNKVIHKVINCDSQQNLTLDTIINVVVMYKFSRFANFD